MVQADRVMSDKSICVAAHLGLRECMIVRNGWCTFIFANIFQGKGQPCVFALDDAHLAKSTSTDNSE